MWYHVFMSRKFFTADHHFFHANIIKSCNRPFSSVEEMNRGLVERWNATVDPNDIIYYGGDMFYRGHTKECGEILDQLNGRIHFVQGNHDKIASKFRSRFESWNDMLEIKHDGKLIVLCHYAMRTWNKSCHDSYHVHGHSHGQLPEDPRSLSFDIGIDCWDYYPVSVEAVLAKMAAKELARAAQV